MGEFKRIFPKDQFGQEHITVQEAKDREASLINIVQSMLSPVPLRLRKSEIYTTAGIKEL